LENEGPSSELALAYLRIAGIHAFQLDYERCRVAAERAAEIAAQASADFERVWALSVVALGHLGTAGEFTLLDDCYQEALAKGYAIIAGNVLRNEIWDRIHSLAGGLEGALEKVERMRLDAWVSSGGEIASSWALLALGAPRDALEQASKATARHESLGNPKFVWRARLAAAEALLELGRTSEAEAVLPAPSPGNELQDVVYDTPVRVGISLALGRVEEAVALGRRAGGDDALLIFRETAAVAVEALVSGGCLDEVKALLSRARQTPSDLGTAGLELAEGRFLLASGRAAEARPLLERALREFEDLGLRLWSWRTQVLAAEAAARTGDDDVARSLLASCLREAHRAGADRVRDDARATAARLGLEVPPLDEERGEDLGEPEFLPAGERLVTSMFADVRGYTPLAATSAPAELADRITTLHRWAAAEVGRRQGIVDKFAGDAVMATFNATRARVDHAVLALEAPLALRDRAALMDLPVGIGIAVGPAVVTRSVDDANVNVLGATTNLAARLQAAAGGGEILLSDEAFRRVASWLSERSLAVEPEELELKGFDHAQPAYRLAAPLSAAAG
jgi:adenylate cyclase